jgi:hypothetical protein
MWQRRTFHECAAELEQVSRQFVEAYTDRAGDAAERRRTLIEASTKGVEILRILSLSIRTEQDNGLTVRTNASVGALKSEATDAEIETFKKQYRPPCKDLKDFKPLRLRQALNKIAHINPTESGFFADATAHDLILTGQDQGGDKWLAVISLRQMCAIIKALPDSRAVASTSAEGL